MTDSAVRKNSYLASNNIMVGFRTATDTPARWSHPYFTFWACMRLVARFSA